MSLHQERDDREGTWMCATAAGMFLALVTVLAACGSPKGPTSHRNPRPEWSYPDSSACRGKPLGRKACWEGSPKR